MLTADLTKRLQFAKNVLKFYEPTFWTNCICSYLNCKNFVRKLHPRDQARAPWARIWRQKDESLNLLSTAKAKISKAVGQLVHFLWLSRICEHYEHYEHLDDPFFAKFIERH